MTTDRSVLRPGPAGPGGYRPLQVAPGEPHVVRADLLGPQGRARAAAEPNGLGGADETLLTVAHLSDLHVCDHQSPARVEFLDRWADADSPALDQLGEVGAYRAQELLTVQAVEAVVRAVNAVDASPVAGTPIDLAVVTGDNTDNAQVNELDWYLALLDGGRVHPDSGDLSRYEGIADRVIDDERYWHPEGSLPDLPRSRNGFPAVPGLLDAIRAPFQAAGLRMPWLAVHGNHDRLIQGTVPAMPGVVEVSTGPWKPIGLPEHWSTEEIIKLMAGLEACDPAALAMLTQARSRRVTPDERRRILGRSDFVRAHHRPQARPAGHGFTSDEVAYYRHDHGPVTLLVMDTVDEFGGWQGSLDRVQFDWLAAELTSADVEGRYVVLVSHHPLDTLVNPAGDDRLLGGAVQELLAGHPSVVLWLAGHDHSVSATPRGSYWEVVAPSLIDWPQQGRIVELSRGGGRIRIAATMLDHAGTAPWDGTTDSIEGLAGLSRELAANDWQGPRFDEQPRAGHIQERNVLLYLPDPFA